MADETEGLRRESQVFGKRPSAYEDPLVTDFPEGNIIGEEALVGKTGPAYEGARVVLITDDASSMEFPEGTIIAVSEGGARAQVKHDDIWETIRFWCCGRDGKYEIAFMDEDMEADVEKRLNHESDVQMLQLCGTWLHEDGNAGREVRFRISDDGGELIYEEDRLGALLTAALQPDETQAMRLYRPSLCARVSWRFIGKLKRNGLRVGVVRLEYKDAENILYVQYRGGKDKKDWKAIPKLSFTRKSSILPAQILKIRGAGGMDGRYTLVENPEDSSDAKPSKKMRRYWIRHDQKAYLYTDRGYWVLEPANLGRGRVFDDAATWTSKCPHFGRQPNQINPVLWVRMNPRTHEWWEGHRVVVTDVSEEDDGDVQESDEFESRLSRLSVPAFIDGVDTPWETVHSNAFYLVSLGDVDCQGVYTLVEGDQSNGYPVWRQMGGDCWLFSGPVEEDGSGNRWMVGYEDDADTTRFETGFDLRLDFQIENAIMRTAEPHNGVYPGKASPDQPWERYDDEGDTWGPASGVKTMPVPAVKEELFVLAPLATNAYKCEGMYMLVESRRPNGLPLWRQVVGNHWLFSGTMNHKLDGNRWFVGGPREKKCRFMKNGGLFCSAEMHYGTMPYVTPDDWQRFDEEAEIWVDDLDVLFRLRGSPEHLDWSQKQAKESASLLIQARYRRLKQKRAIVPAIARRDEERKLKFTKRMATRLQAVFRGNRSRKKTKPELDAWKALQAEIRRYQADIDKQQEQALVEEISILEMQRFIKRFQAYSLVQTEWTLQPELGPNKERLKRWGVWDEESSSEESSSSSEEPETVEVVESEKVERLPSEKKPRPVAKAVLAKAKAGRKVQTDAAAQRARAKAEREALKQ